MNSRPWNPRVICCNVLDLKALLLIQGVIVATCLSTFVAALQLAPEPSPSSPSASSSSSLCSRALATTLWGAAFAFFSLMADAWPASKALTSLSPEGHSLIYRFSYFLLIAAVVPLVGIYSILESMCVTLRFRRILTSSTNRELVPNFLYEDFLVLLFGIDQPRGFLKSTRLVANTYIVLGISDSTTLPDTHIVTKNSPVKEDNMADALTLGHKTAGNSCLMQLNEAGKLALLESSILPNYKQLQFLDGRSVIATLIIGVQTIGYVTSIVYRAIHHLPVSPIEVIGFSFSMLVIVCSLVHSVGGICQKPLVIYLNPTLEQEMLDKCRSTQWSNADAVICQNVTILGMVVVGSVVMALTILVQWHALKTSLSDPIGPVLFCLSFITQLLGMIIEMKSPSSIAKLAHSIFYWCILMSLGGTVGGIVGSIMATILNWQTNQYDSRTPSVIHNLPFLG